MSYYIFLGFVGLIAALFTIGVKEEDWRYKFAAIVLFILWLGLGIYQMISSDKL